MYYSISVAVSAWVIHSRPELLHSARVRTQRKNEWVVQAAGRERHADLAATLGQTEQAGGGREGGQVSEPLSSVKNLQTTRGTSQCVDLGCVQQQITTDLNKQNTATAFRDQQVLSD